MISIKVLKSKIAECPTDSFTITLEGDDDANVILQKDNVGDVI